MVNWTGAASSERYIGSSGDDVLNGSGGNDEILGGAGNDTIEGGPGEDTIQGGDGNDLITDSDGLLLSAGEGNDTISGGGGGLMSVVHGDTGDDSITIITSITDTQTYTGKVYGGSGNDTINIFSDAAEVHGDGFDVLTANTSVRAGSGDDIITIENATVFSVAAGLGHDTVVIRGVWGNDDPGFATFDGIVIQLDDYEIIGGNDTLDASQFLAEVIAWGYSGDDTFIGQSANFASSFYAGDGNDSISGGSGDDYLQGGIGSDTIKGNSGNDTIGGGDGVDILSGGSGSDVFLYDFDGEGHKFGADATAGGVIYSQPDIITDFKTGNSGDQLDFRPLFSALGYTGADPFGDGWLKLEQDSNDILVKLDRTGSGSFFTETVARLQNTTIAEFTTFNALPAGPVDENRVPTGVVTISGTAAEGQILTAITSTIIDADGFSNEIPVGLDNAPEDTRLWTVSGVPIRVKDIGKTFTNFDGEGFESITVNTDGSLSFNGALPGQANLNDFMNYNTGGQYNFDGTQTLYTISDDARVYVTPANGELFLFGQINAELWGLSEDDLLKTADFDFQWLANGNPIPNATNRSYTLTQNEVGKSISVQISYIDGAGTRETLISTTTPTIQGSPSQSNGFGEEHITNPAIELVHDGNFYRLVQTSVNFGEAITRAENSYFQGVQGHLVTITDLSENLALWQKFSAPYYGNIYANVWIALSDAQNEGIWVWQSGPEKNTPTSYQSWSGFEPNNYNTQEDAALLHWGETGAWQDYNLQARWWYIVEYEGSELQPSAHNHTPTGAVTISGIASEGNQLIAITSTISDTDGLGTFSYQWLRDGSPITGANSRIYTIADDDIGDRISVRITYTDGGGTTEILISETTSPVQEFSSDERGFGSEHITDPTLEVVYEGNLYRLVQVPVNFYEAITQAESTYFEGVRGHLVTLTSQAENLTIWDALVEPYPSSYQEPGNPWIALSDASSEGIWVWQSGPEKNSPTTFQSWAGLEPSNTNNEDAATLYSGGRGAWNDLNTSWQQWYIVEFEGSLLSSTIGNHSPTGTVVISGNGIENQTLTAITSSISDEDGLGVLSFQWLANDIPISGATGPSYTLTQNEVGKSITAQVTYTDGGGATETLTSPPTSAVANVNDVPQLESDFIGNGFTNIPYPDSEFIVVSGTIANGGTTLEAGTIFIQYAYSGNTPVPYKVVIGEEADDFSDWASGRDITQFTSLNGDAFNNTITISADSGIANEDIQVYVVSQSPYYVYPWYGVAIDIGQGLNILGRYLEDEVLSLEIPDISDEDGLGALSFQWLANGSLISGATGRSYTLTQNEVGKSITAQVTYTDGGGNTETLTSTPTSAVANVNDAPTGSVVVSGNAIENETLTAVTSSISDEDGLGPLNFQWLSNGTPISGATGRSYTLTQNEVGKSITAQVTYTDDGGTTETLNSTPTSAVANVNDAPTGTVVISGNAIADEMLTAVTSSISDEDGLGPLNFQWLSNGTTILGATGRSYTLTQNEVGKSISVLILYTDGGGTTETLISAQTDAVAAIVRETIVLSDTADTFNGTDLPEIISTQGGNDFITASKGNDRIDGGFGIDTVLYDGNQNSYTVTLTSSGVQVRDRRTDGNGTDTLTNTEFLVFDAGPYAEFNLTQFGGAASLNEEAFRGFIELYIAYYNRAPDAIGLNFWGTAYANGTSMEEMATLFAGQSETLRFYPENTTNAEFAEAVYNNVLGRTPDQAGFGFWVNSLNSGFVSRDQFILEVLGGVQDGSTDRVYLDNKVNVGAYFAVHKGLSDTSEAAIAMALYDGSDLSLQSVKQNVDSFHAAALDPLNGDFLLPLVGVLADPFA